MRTSWVLAVLWISISPAPAQSPSMMPDLPTRAEAQPTPSQYPGYTLVWHDEFESDGPPNAGNWTFETGFVRNREEQSYQSQNAWCQNGFLIIEARRERTQNPRFVAGSSDWRTNRPDAAYTSASLTTRNRHTWTYGRFEMRARIDTRTGVWPAWWMMGSTRGWPNGGEVDIMEAYAGLLNAAFRWGAAVPGQVRLNMATSPIAQFAADWPSRFHVWRMDWDEESIKIYMDGRMLNQATLSQTINENGPAINPFTQPQFMIIDLAVGGESGGDPSRTSFPARLLVDYVRVYQKVPPFAARPVTPANP